MGDSHDTAMSSAVSWQHWLFRCLEVEPASLVAKLRPVTREVRQQRELVLSSDSSEARIRTRNRAIASASHTSS